MRSSFFSKLVNGPFGDPALLVRAAHRRDALLFDCGDLHLLAPRELLKIQSVFISHGHIDHLAGFDHLLRHFLYREKPLTLYGPPGIGALLTHRLASYTWNLIEGYPLEIRVREWHESGRGRQLLFRAANSFRPQEEPPFICDRGLLLDTAHLQVRTLPLRHGDILSLAFTLEEKLHVAIHRDALERHGYLPGRWLTDFKDLLRRGAPADTAVVIPCTGGGETRASLGPLAEEIAHCEEGMKITYVTDCSPTAENFSRIEKLAAASHLLAIESTFSHAELARARERNHLTAYQAGDLARRAGAKKILLFHHSPRYQDHPRLLQEEALQAFSGTPSDFP